MPNAMCQPTQRNYHKSTRIFFNKVLSTARDILGSGADRAAHLAADSGGEGPGVEGWSKVAKSSIAREEYNNSGLL